MKQDIIEISQNQDGKSILYARFERLHEDEYLLLMKEVKEKKIIYKNIKNDIDINEFLEKVYYFEKNHNKFQNKIFALSFEILLPEKINTTEKKLNFIKAFKKQLLADISIYLNCFAMEYQKGRGTYLKLIVFERVYIGKTVNKRYKKPCYTYPKINGETVQIMTRKANTIMRDKLGNKIKEYVVFGDKLRFYNFSSINEYRIRLTQMIETAITKTFTIKYTGCLRFKRKTVYATANRFKRAVAILINQVKQEIETALNQHYLPLLRQLEAEDERYYIKYSPEAYKLAKLKAIFNEIEGVFNQNKLVLNGNEYLINYRYVLLPDLKISLVKLKQFFYKKIENFLKNF